MEKIVCALWADRERGAFNARLLTELPSVLRAAGASVIRINVRDEVVDAGSALIQIWQSPQQDAVVQFWLPSANSLFRAGVDAALAQYSSRFAGWLVSESTIIANIDHPSDLGERSWGWSQCSFINFRDDLDRMDAISAWHNHHTRIAIDTQSNFEYVQNLIVVPLTPEAPAFDAFVEECFPLEALADPSIFFNAQGDPAKFDDNLAAMMSSCNRFIEFGKIDIIPTSQYDF